MNKRRRFEPRRYCQYLWSSMRTSSTAIIAMDAGNTDVRYVLEIWFLWISQGESSVPTLFRLSMVYL